MNKSEALAKINLISTELADDFASAANDLELERLALQKALGAIDYVEWQFGGHNTFAFTTAKAVIGHIHQFRKHLNQRIENWALKVINEPVPAVEMKRPTNVEDNASLKNIHTRLRSDTEKQDE